MKVTRKLTSQIRKVAEAACGGKRRFEVGDRFQKTSKAVVRNILLSDTENDDLFDTTKLADFVGESVDEYKGCVLLDLYCYYTGEDGDLDTNVYVLIHPDANAVVAYKDELESKIKLNVDNLYRG